MYVGDVTTGSQILPYDLAVGGLVIGVHSSGKYLLVCTSGRTAAIVSTRT